MIYYRIDVQPPGSPGWLRFKSYEDEAEAVSIASSLCQYKMLYQHVKIVQVREDEVWDDSFLTTG